MFHVIVEQIIAFMYNHQQVSVQCSRSVEYRELIMHLRQQSRLYVQHPRDNFVHVRAIVFPRNFLRIFYIQYTVVGWCLDQHSFVEWLEGECGRVILFISVCCLTRRIMLTCLSKMTIFKLCLIMSPVFTKFGYTFGFHQCIPPVQKCIQS